MSIKSYKTLSAIDIKNITNDVNSQKSLQEREDLVDKIRLAIFENAKQGHSYYTTGISNPVTLNFIYNYFTQIGYKVKIIKFKQNVMVFGFEINNIEFFGTSNE